jgi:zinc protease
MRKVRMQQQGRVLKKILSNGLVILVHPLRHIPKVSINLWYGVGSKHENSNERGLAHLVEHMIFKGTHEKLSESDIDATTTKLSGYTNAFTSYDYTCYVFDFPSSSWKHALPLLSDCMRNCRFDEQMLNSELSAVIQELKMYRDDYFDTLLSRMAASIFPDHPYHYPVIGFKQDLWNLQRDALVAFYKKHYVPNNAVLVVVGDVDPEEVFVEAEKAFGHIPRDPHYKQSELYHGESLIGQCVTLYRDIQQSQAALTYVLPGARDKNRYLYEVTCGALGKGKSSRLYAKIVDELELASELHVAIDQRQDATLMDITFQPNNDDDIDAVIEIIQQEIQTIIDKGFSEKELKRAQKQVKASLLSVLENGSEQANLIGEAYILTGDEQLIFKEIEEELIDADSKIRSLLKTYCSPLRRHEGRILPMTEDMKERWIALQELSDQEDQRILEGRTRTSLTESSRYACSVEIPPLQKHSFTKFCKEKLSNGLTVITAKEATVPKIDLVLSLPVREYADPQDKQGLYRFVCDLLLEGTKNYPGSLLAEEVEGYGMTLTTEPGTIVLSVLKEDLKKGLEFLRELVMYGEFPVKTIEKVRAHILSDLMVYWDEPQEFSNHILRRVVYEGHPYSKDPHGTLESIKTISKKDIEDFYKSSFVPGGATLVIVGDVEGYDVMQEVHHYLGEWQGKVTQALDFPVLNPLVPTTISYPINRDQVVLMFAGRSIKRLHEDYEKLLLFDQIFGGGTNGSMTSHLMKIREQTGLFYGIRGSLIVGCDEETGMVLIKTTVSVDRLDEAKEIIWHAITTAVDAIDEEEFEEAKRTIINGLIDNMSSTKKIAGSLLGLERLNLSSDYFDTLSERIQAITLEEMKTAARKILNPSAMITIQIGRVE